MRFLILPCLLLFSSVAQAAFTDFSDYDQYEEFGLGETFLSNDLSFEVVGLVSPSVLTPARIFADSTRSFLIPGPGVQFLLPTLAHEISFRYGGAGYAIAVNGDLAESGPVFQTPLDDLDGTILGGVSITITRDAPHPAPGFLTLRGPINSLSVAGIELWIDDITVIVPEPATFGMVVFAVAGILSRRWR